MYALYRFDVHEVWKTCKLVWAGDAEDKIYAFSFHPKLYEQMRSSRTSHSNLASGVYLNATQLKTHHTPITRKPPMADCTS